MSAEVKRQLQKRLGHEFADPDLLDLALTHRSFAASNNERLEFLGDSILNFVIGDALYERFAAAREGQLSRMRSNLVRGDTLAAIGAELSLGECLRLGEGEMKSGGRERESILADTVEALIGAIYRDAGFAACAERVLSWYRSRLEALSLDQPAKDAKTRLQEYMQARRQPLPEYRVLEASNHAQTHQFTVECRVALLDSPTIASAASRRAAEKQAAARALAQLPGAGE